MTESTKFQEMTSIFKAIDTPVDNYNATVAVRLIASLLM